VADEEGKTLKGKVKPQVAVDYNFHMHGVDKADAFANMYLYKHRKVSVYVMNNITNALHAY
jgi:hypothetical protein